jgi:hypothetical protein
MVEATFKKTRVSYDYHWSTYAYSGFNPVSPQVTSGSFFADCQSSGYKLPNWRDRIRNRQSATTLFGSTSYTVSNSFITAGNEALFVRDVFPVDRQHRKAEAFGVYPIGNFLSPGAPSSAVQARVRNRALSRFLAEVRSAFSSIEGGQDLGEYREAIHSVLHPMQSLRDLTVKYLSKLKKAKGRYKHSNISLKKALADSYLEWTFGWNPLISDIAEGFVAIQNSASAFPTKKVYGSSSEDFQGSNVEVYLAPAANLNLSYTDKRTYQFSTRIKGEVKVLAPGATRFSDAEILGFTPREFAPTAWDLLPLSFVADYFTNIGDMILALSLIGTDYVFTCRDEVSKVKWEISNWKSLDHNTPPPGYNMVVDNRWCRGGNSTLEAKSLNRMPLNTEELLPTPEFHIPLSKKPWENLGAILASSTKGLVPFYH